MSNILQKIKDSNSSILNLSNCNLKQIPEEVFELTQLKILLLSNNKLTSLPIEICNLIQLVNLNFNYN